MTTRWRKANRRSRRGPWPTYRMPAEIRRQFISIDRIHFALGELGVVESFRFIQSPKR